MSNDYIRKIIADLENKFKVREEPEYRSNSPKTTKSIVRDIELLVQGKDILSQLTDRTNKLRSKYHKGEITWEELQEEETKSAYYYRKLNKIVQKYGEPKETIEEIMSQGLEYLKRYENNTMGLAQTRETE